MPTMNEGYWGRVLDTRITRRKALVGTGTAVAGAVLLAACGDPEIQKPTLESTAIATLPSQKDVVLDPETVRRAEGNWTDQDIENLAKKMMDQPELSDTPFA